uniref:Uncharacterized protein n=1 Tax=Corethron hystrix TaxID=216773 RepID=A0A7S1BZH0_9STRA|mmetsp:Transcript_6361/g.13749  ORF Transcript_6361/g.13749 Transcript_6361/m.13749 type:complete len:420 (+) Transcript_6361:24-1283(+)
MKKFCVLSLLALLHARSSDASGHAGEEPCACVAEEQGFSIDCSDTATMLASLNELKTRSCATDCSSAECVKHYFIVQSHHDYCPEENIPQEVEDGFHDYDETCMHCKIKRLFTPGAPSCPAAVCTDGSGNQAYATLLDKGCVADCSSDECRDLFFTLRSVHDNCPHDALSRAAEEGLHDLEVPCADQICNQAAGADSQLVCDAHGHGDGPFEWAGVFAVDDASHTWSMQKVDGAYADPSMRLVFFSTATPNEDALHALEEAGGALIEGDCAVVADGGTIGPITATGACFDLQVGAGDDSSYGIDTSGLAGIVVFAQHVPIEFERDRHYFYDSSSVDIEPVAEEGGGGHGHGHGHDDHEEPDDHDSHDKEDDHDHDSHDGHDHDSHDEEEVDPKGATSSAAIVTASAAAAVLLGSTLMMV